MIQSGRAIDARPASAAAVRAQRFRSTLLVNEVVVGSSDLARVGLVALALVLQTLVLYSPGHFRPAGTAAFAFLVCFGTLGSLGLCFLASLPIRRLFDLRLRRILAASAIVVLTVLAVIGTTRVSAGLDAMRHGTPYNNDGAVMDLYAAKQTLHGHNPYLKTNIVLALAAINAPATTTTPLKEGQFRGEPGYPSDAAVDQVFLNVLRHRAQPGVPIPPEFESKYNYPSLSFLFILPFVWMGLHDMRFLYALAVLAMGTYLWVRMPRPLRPTVPLLVLGSVPLVVLTAGGQPDPLYGLLLMLAYAEWRHSWSSPLAMGLAVATKQLAWFFLPFYLILVWRHLGRREAMRRTGLVAGVFLLTNGPFILHSPGPYLASIGGPMQDPMFPLGIGVVALFVSNVVPMLPKLAFTVAEMLAWLGGSTAYAARLYLLPATGIVLGALPLFFAWRSLVNYFYLVPLLTLAVVLADRDRDTRTFRT